MNKKEKDFVVSIGSSDRHFRQEDYEYVYANIKNETKEIAWKNDRLNSLINILSKENDIVDLDVEVSDFISGNNILSKENIVIKTIKNVKGHIGRGFEHGQIPNFPKEDMPDIIYQKLPINMEANTLQSLWVKFKIPKDIEEGLYNGTITFKASNFKTSHSLNYTIEIIDCVQPELVSKDSLSIELWQYPYTVARYYGIEEANLFKEKHLAILKEHLLMYKEIGGQSITTTIVEDPWNHQTYDTYPSMVKWTKKIDGNFTYDFTHFDAYVKLAISLGINKQIKSYSFVPWENRIFYFDESTNEMQETRPKPGTSEWDHLWSTFLKVFVKHLDDKGWFNITYIALDERPMDVLKHAINLVEIHPNKDGKYLKIHSAMNYNAIDDPILDKIDDISLNLGHTNHKSNELRNLSQNRRNKNLTTTLYSATEDYPNSFAYSNPSESAWTIWYAAAHNTDGFLRWAFDAWVENPLEDISHWYWESGDPFFIYPSDTKDVTPYITPRFEKLKEGMRDVAKAKYLASLSEENKSIITNLLKSIGRVEGVKNVYGAKVSGSKENREFIDQEVRRLKDAVNDLAIKSMKRTT